jgi:uncharacterized protein YjeT (DUF2065 family)
MLDDLFAVDDVALRRVGLGHLVAGGPVAWPASQRLPFGRFA